jgi:hypothetical protein
MSEYRGYADLICTECGDAGVESKRLSIGQPFRGCLKCFGLIPLRYTNEWDLMNSYEKTRYFLRLVRDSFIYTFYIIILVLLIISWYDRVY